MTEFQWCLAAVVVSLAVFVVYHLRQIGDAADADDIDIEEPPRLEWDDGK